MFVLTDNRDLIPKVKGLFHPTSNYPQKPRTKEKIHIVARSTLYCYDQEVFYFWVWGDEKFLIGEMLESLIQQCNAEYGDDCRAQFNDSDLYRDDKKFFNREFEFGAHPSRNSTIWMGTLYQNKPELEEDVIKLSKRDLGFTYGWHGVYDAFGKVVPERGWYKK